MWFTTFADLLKMLRRITRLGNQLCDNVEAHCGIEQAPAVTSNGDQPRLDGTAKRRKVEHVKD